MKILIEFPMHIVNNYFGAEKLDSTLDDNITYLIGKYFFDKQIDFEILNIDFISAVPNKNDELVRYQVELGLEKDSFNFEYILNNLKNSGFEKGLTIKSNENEILYADRFTADIQL